VARAWVERGEPRTAPHGGGLRFYVFTA